MRWKKSLLSLFLSNYVLSTIIFICLYSFPAFSVEASQEQNISDFEKRLAQIKQEIILLEKKIKEERERESTLLAQLNQLSLEKKLLVTEMNLTLTELQKVERELSWLKNEIKLLQDKMKRQREQMEKTMVSLYKYGRFRLLDLFFRANNLASLIAESKRLQIIIHHQDSTLAEYWQTEANLKETTQQLTLKQNELSQLYQAAAEKKKEVEAKEKNLKEFVSRIQKNKQLFEQTLKEYQERAEQLQNLMNKLINQEISFPFPFVPFYERKGKLPWPVAGKVITYFGLQRHARFNTITINNGIEIVPPAEGRIAKAVHAGKVVYADTFQGYGDLIIIDHGLNYYSLYGHCAEFLVKKGDWVREGQPVAIVGDSGSLKGICLYFEIRYKTKALDPLQWLRKK